MRTGLRKDEELILEVRKHWFILVKHVMFMLIAFFIAYEFFLAQEIERFRDYLRQNEVLDDAALIIIGAVIVSILNYVYRVIDRRCNIWAVTNLRVIDEWGVLSRNAKESILSKIHNVSYNQPLIGRVFNFGNVMIQTAAEAGETVNYYVTSPKLVQSTIVKCQDEYRETQDNTNHVPEILSRGTDDIRECPYCAETIRKKAKVCKHCASRLETQ